MTIEKFIEENYPNQHWDEASAKMLAIEYAKYQLTIMLKKINDEHEISQFAGEKNI